MALEMRQGTVYLEKKSGRRFILINHNPMALLSMRVWSDSAKAPFNLAQPEMIPIDDLIPLRQSGEYEELGDLPSETFKAMVNALIGAGNFSEEDLKLLKSLI
jgi:hypothetical protein